MRKFITALSMIAIAFIVSVSISFAEGSAYFLGPVDALNTLDSQIGALPASAFKNPQKADKEKKKLLHDIDSLMHQVEHGKYNDAVKKLNKTVRKNVEAWLGDSERTKITESIDNTVVSIDNAAKTTVKTSYGKVAGFDAHNDSWAWMGIPYAKPPVGDLRWKAPQDPKPWEKIRFSFKDFSCCIQPVSEKHWDPLNQVKGSEDCLYLNVYRPKTSTKDLPVYFWIHGGGNVQGGADEFLWASTLAKKSNMVVVVIQYRLGPFGWFTHPSLKLAGTMEEQSGNFGTLDIIKALHWVRKNITAFGGNADNITVAGESAGAFNTLNLMISPLAKGLFHRAVAESAGGANIPVSAGVERANQMIDKLLVADGTCPDLTTAAAHRGSLSNAEIATYLKSKSADEIERTIMSETGLYDTISPFIDGTVIPGTFETIFESGNYNKVPVILGSNEYEMKPFLPLILGSMPTSSGYKWSNVYNALGLAKPAISLEELMPSSGFDRYLYEACGKYPSLNWKAAMVDSLAKILEKHQDNVYCYFFKWGGIGSGSSPFDFLIGAGHAFELSFFFGWDVDIWNASSYTDANKEGRTALQKAMMSYVASFAASGDPNRSVSGLPTWAQWSNTEGGTKSIIFDADLTKAKISMMNEEVTREGVMAQMNALPESVRELVKVFLWF